MALLAEWWATALATFVLAAVVVGLWRLLREPRTDSDPGLILPLVGLWIGLFALVVLASISASLLAVYFVIWWTVLFAVLPFGARSQAETGDVAPGTEPAAPGQPLLIRKAVVTSLISAVLFALFYWVRFHSGIGLADLPFLPEIHY